MYFKILHIDSNSPEFAEYLACQAKDCGVFMLKMALPPKNVLKVLEDYKKSKVNSKKDVRRYVKTITKLLREHIPEKHIFLLRRKLWLVLSLIRDDKKVEFVNPSADTIEVAKEYPERYKIYGHFWESWKVFSRKCIQLINLFKEKASFCLNFEEAVDTFMEYDFYYSQFVLRHTIIRAFTVAELCRNYNVNAKIAIEEGLLEIYFAKFLRKYLIERHIDENPQIRAFYFPYLLKAIVREFSSEYDTKSFIIPSHAKLIIEFQKILLKKFDLNKPKEPYEFPKKYLRNKNFRILAARACVSAMAFEKYIQESVRNIPKGYRDYDAFFENYIKDLKKFKKLAKEGRASYRFKSFVDFAEEILPDYRPFSILYEVAKYPFTLFDLKIDKKISKMDYKECEEAFRKLRTGAKVREIF